MNKKPKVPDKLVVVGMRYLHKSNLLYVERLGAEVNLSLRDPVPVRFLVEPNINGVDNKAVAVTINDNKCGYIRNADLESYKDYLKNAEEDTSFVLVKYTPNYIVLERTAELVVAPKSQYTAYTSDYNTIASNHPAQEYFARRINVGNVTGNTTNTFANKEPEKMNIQSNMRDQFFREVKNVAIDIQSGKFGVQSAEGISVYVNGGISVNPITDFGVKVPAFAMRVAVDSLTEGDIIINGSESSFFKGKTENGYEVVTLSGEVKQVGTVTNMFFGKNTVLAVKNMFGENTNPMMMAMMLGDGKDFDMKSFAMLSMMGGGQMDSNMLMMMMLMNK